MTGTFLRIATAATLALSMAPAHAQGDEVRFAVAAEEAVSAAIAESLRANISDERSRLLVRLQANAPDQAAGSITTTASELAGKMIADAMRRLLILQPADQPVVVAIAPQMDPDGSRQLVLLNLSAWIAKGRLLGVDDLETFAVLPDQEMRQAGGSPFQLNGVSYFGAVEGSSIAFHRKP